MFKNIVKIITGSAAGQLISVALLPVVANIYGPSALGVTGVIQSVAMIFALVFSFRVDNILIRSKNSITQSLLELSSVWSVFVISAANVIFFILYLLGAINANIALLSALTAFSAFFIAKFDIYKSICVKNSEIKNIAFVSAFRSPVLPALQIGLFYIFYDDNASNLAYFFSCIIIFILVKNFPKKIYIKNKKINYKRAVAVAFILKKDLLKNIALGILNYSNNFGLPIFVAFIFGEKEAGLIALSMRIVGIPVALIGRAVSDVFVGRAITVINAKGNLFYEVKKICSKLILLTVAPTIAIFIVPEYIYTKLLGEDWVGIKYSVCSIWFIGVLQLVVGSVAQVLLLMKKEGFLILWEISRGIVVVCFLFMMASNNFEYKTILYAYSIVSCCFYIYLAAFIVKNIKNFSAT